MRHLHSTERTGRPYRDFEFDHERDLREAAARLKADLLLLYTFDTSFHDNDASVALKVVTLGLSPTRRVFVRVTASALVIDMRTG